jgi:polar amino acid transport system ATP-binding protein
MSEAMVKAQAVHKRFGRLEVLKGIDLEVQRGEVMCMLGPSGSGKSTFLRCINHLEKINSGRLYVDGELVGYRDDGAKLHELHEREVARKRAEIGMVFQQFNLFLHMTALENVMLAPTRVLKVSRDEARERATGQLSRVGLGDKLDTYPVALSGGQQQRVAIARALITSPSIILADEPTGNLDSRTSVEVMEILQQLNEQSITIILVTHEPDIAAYCHRVVHFRDGQIIDDQINPNPLSATAALAELQPKALEVSLS